MTAAQGKANFYCGNGVILHAPVPLPPPDVVQLRVSLLPPSDPRFWTMASEERTFRRSSHGELDYEPAPADAKPAFTTNAFVYMNESAAARLHEGKLTTKAIAADILGPKDAWGTAEL
jgi:hypothetical protein